MTMKHTRQTRRIQLYPINIVKDSMKREQTILTVVNETTSNSYKADIWPEIMSVSRIPELAEQVLLTSEHERLQLATEKLQNSAVAIGCPRTPLRSSSTIDRNKCKHYCVDHYKYTLESNTSQNLSVTQAVELDRMADEFENVDACTVHRDDDDIDHKRRTAGFMAIVSNCNFFFSLCAHVCTCTADRLITTRTAYLCEYFLMATCKKTMEQSPPSTNPTLKRLCAGIDLKQAFVQTLLNDESLQSAIADVVQKNDNSITVAAEKIVNVMFDSLLKHLCDQIELLESRTIKLEQKTLDLERYNRSFNLRFYGFEERGTNDNTKKRVSEFLTKNLETKIHHPVIENCHRVGVKRADKPRPIIVGFHSRPFRQLILTSLTKLKGQNLGITVVEDLTK
ncbi:unnamed protein product [Didymodactylos carnosus]|uniref:Uncharacterized protein n=1 Tax=Didymodactylos carnosus TaxID=1234261 RepID=A0A815CFD3_9BILA|nr:unnamed protein product [Didymodactylos carnosus]CAF4079909.1 unnamed protein product [Didymodactylos carnosus]